MNLHIFYTVYIVGLFGGNMLVIKRKNAIILFLKLAPKIICANLFSYFLYLIFHRDISS